MCFKNVLLILLCGCYSIHGAVKVRLDNMGWDEDCQLDPNTERIQIALVVDISTSNKPYVDKLHESLDTIITNINNLHNGTEIALITQANWPKSAYGVQNGHDVEEGCYDATVKFTTDTTALKDAATSITYLDAPSTKQPEGTAVAAVSFCAADETLGWVRETYDAAGLRVHRFIVLLTDKYSRFDLAVPGTRTKFRGDGTDTCQTSLPPSLEKLRGVLDEKDVHIIGAYFKKPETVQKYIQSFKDYGFGYRHCHAMEEFQNSADFATDLSELVSQCISMYLRCVFLDPPGGYNTLGL